MTYQESYALIKELMAVKTKDELQDKMGEHMARVDGTFQVLDLSKVLRSRTRSLAKNVLVIAAGNRARPSKSRKTG